MTRIERLSTLSSDVCCVCDRPLSVQDVDEFHGVADESLHGVLFCHACMEEELVLCRECSCRYTADGLCGECAAREYALAV